MELKKLNNNSKADIASQIRALQDSGKACQAIVKVTQSGYVPQGFKVRSWLNDFMFTADCTTDAAKATESDDNIESVSINQRLQSIQ